MAQSWSFILTCCLWLCLAHDVAGQLPVASGRQLSLSNSAWKVFIPSTYQHRAGNVADLLVHFHGDSQTVWNNALHAELNTIVLTVNYGGLSSAYSGPFSNSALFGSMLEEALGAVRAQRDFSSALAWDQLGVSSFSAGYGAVREILKSSTYRNQIDSLLAADSLYATTAADGTPLDSQMVNYKTFASLAQAGSKTFLFSHSQVATYTYESTLETGNELLEHLGVSSVPHFESGLGTLDFYRYAESGNFRLWGALGADGDSHLEHLRYIGEFFTELPLAKTAIPGDFDQDDDVDGRDFLVWQRDHAPLLHGPPHLTAWKQHYGSQAGQAGSLAVVPEPTAMVTLAAGMLLLLAGRRGTVLSMADLRF